MKNSQDILLRNCHYADINPRVCGWQVCDAQHQFGPAQRTHWLLHYVVSGQGVFCSPRGEYAVKAGQIFVIRPNETTVYTADEVNPWQYIWLGFESSLSMPQAFSEDVFFAGDLAPIFEAVKITEQMPNPELYLCSCIMQLLAQLPTSQQASGVGAQYVEKALNYIHAGYQNEIKISNLADRLNVDRSYFSSVFRAATGVSPQQYLVRHRLKKAAELMREKHIPPGQAALMVGYTDAAGFSRMFRRYYGVSPRDYKVRGANV